MKDYLTQFIKEKKERILSYKNDNNLKDISKKWILEAFKKNYMYNWSWLERPIIQLPNDILATAEIIQKVKPDLIVETGIAHGGSLVFSASMLSLLDYIEALENGIMLDPNHPKRKVLAVDIEIREQNLKLISSNPMSNRIKMIEGSSISEEVIQKVRNYITENKKVLVFLDSNHTEEHVFEELKLYGPLVSKNSYCIVMDTIVEDLPFNFFKNRPWNPGNSPKTAIKKFISECKNKNLKGYDNFPLNFRVDMEVDNKLLLSAAPGGFLKRD